MFKKSMGIIAAIIIIFAAAAPSAAAPPALSISGSTTVRAGDTITLKVYLNGTGLLAANGEITFNSNLISYVSYGGTLAGWIFDSNEEAPGKIKFMVYDNYLTSPINSKKQIFSLTFKVKSNLAAGTNIKVSVQNVSASDGNADIAVSAAAYSVNIAPPLSGNANLKTLTVGNATISPAFSPSVTNYTASVPFEVSELDVTATAEDRGARVDISGKNLSVGQNTVTITVTAANGAKKTYTISVTRAQDPNYVPSSNANLKSVTLSAGILTPLFDPSVTEYAAYVPYEQQSITVGGEAEDGNAGVMGEERELVVGENRLKITVTAENGSTKEYFVSVFRMPQYIPPSQTETTPAPETTATETTAAFETTAGQTTGENPGTTPGKFKDIPFWTMAAIGVLCAMIGFGGCFFVMRGRKE
jgi:hypothetical protein